MLPAIRWRESGLLYKMKFINIHTHSHLSSDAIELINHQVQDEWNPQIGRLYSVGFHPWYVHQYEHDEMISLVDNLSKYEDVLAIGECGLDRHIENLIEIQENVFIKQVEIAERVQKPLIIHSVKTYPDLIRIKKARKVEIPWILHGYNGNTETTMQLLKHDFYFSFGAAILNDLPKLNESLKLIPLNRLFFETDIQSEKIKTIYTFAATVLKCSVEELKTLIFNNFKQVFKYE